MIRLLRRKLGYKGWQGDESRRGLFVSVLVQLALSVSSLVAIGIGLGLPIYLWIALDSPLVFVIASICSLIAGLTVFQMMVRISKSQRDSGMLDPIHYLYLPTPAEEPLPLLGAGLGEEAPDSLWHGGAGWQGKEEADPYTLDLKMTSSNLYGLEEEGHQTEPVDSIGDNDIMNSNEKNGEQPEPADRRWKANQVGLGLDIGSAGIKIVLVRTDRRGELTVEFSRYLQTPPGIVNLGEVQDAEGIGAVLRSALGPLKKKYRRATVSLGRNAVVIRHVSLPEMSQRDLAQAIRWEAIEYLGGTPDSISVDFIQLPASQEHLHVDESEILDDDFDRPADGNQINLVMIAARKHVVRSHLEAVKAANLHPQAIEVGPVADIRAVDALGYLALAATETGEGRQEPEPVAVLSIGHSGTQLVIFYEGYPRLVRKLDFSGDDVLDEMGRTLKLRASVIEKVLFNVGSDFVSNPDEIRDRIKEFLEGKQALLFMEIRRSLEYFVTRARQPVRRLFLAGGYSTLPGLREGLEDYLLGTFAEYLFMDPETEAGDPGLKGSGGNQALQVLLWGRPAGEKAFLEGLDPRFMTAFALAIRDFERTKR